MLWYGTETSYWTSPILYLLAASCPMVTPKPTASNGWKYTLSFLRDSKYSLLIGIVNVSASLDTISVSVCPIPGLTNLSILKTFLSWNILLTLTISWLVTPIATVEPIEILFGTDERYMSVTNPRVVLWATGAIKCVVSELTPILWGFVNPEMNVDTPETTAVSPSSKACVGEICTEIWLELSQINVASW